MTGSARFGIGFLIGAVVVGGLASGLDEGEPEPAATAAATTAPAERVVVPWVEAGEVILGATALLPRSFTIEESTAFFDYDLVGLGPTLSASAESEEPLGDPLALPELWILRTVAGETVEAETGPFDTSVRFDLPGVDTEVASVSLIGWRVRVPFGEQIELAIEEGASGSTRRGTATIETLLEQSVSTIVQIDLDRGDDPWQAGIVLRPQDTRWRVSGRQGGGLQLIWDGSDAPGTVVLEDAGFEMRPIAGEIVVIDEAGLP